MKTCFKCKKRKPLDDFYKHKLMADGFLNKCKACAKNDSTKHRLSNLEKVREYDRERGKQPHRQVLKTIVTKAWRAEDEKRSRAHNAVSRAIKKGLLLQKPCERCLSEKSIAHHEDYSKPLSVTWLCQPCHKQRHKELKEDF